MKINSPISDNLVKKDYSKYIVYAILSAFLFYFFLDFSLQLIIILAKLIYQYKWYSLGILFIILIIRKRRNKKKK